MSKNDIEERLVRFSVSVILFAETLPKSYTGIHLSGQIIRSSSSAALNYGEAQSAESPKDFIHKMKVVLKELRETFINLRIIDGVKMCKDAEELQTILKENNELFSIFVTSINTARKNSGRLMKQR